MYRQTPCHEHLLKGMHAFDIIPKVYGEGPVPVVKPGTPFAGSVTLAGYTGDPPCDIYDFDGTDEGWILIAFDAEVGEGAELVKRVFALSDLSTSLIALGNDAYVKASWYDRGGILVDAECSWAHIVNGKVTILTPGEAIAHGLEKPKVEKVQLVVTDEPAIAEYLVENGVADPGVPVVEVASIEDVRGINIAGDVPMHCAVYARSVTSVVLADIPRRGNKKLTLRQVRKNVLDVRRYSVERS